MDVLIPLIVGFIAFMGMVVCLGYIWVFKDKK